MRIIICILFGLTSVIGQVTTTLSVQYDGTIPNSTITVVSSTGIGVHDNLLLCSNQVVAVASKAGNVLTVTQVLGKGNASIGVICSSGTPVTNITLSPLLTFNAESFTGTQTFLLGQQSGVTTQLTTALASRDTTINVASTVGLSNVDMVIVCGEAILTSAKTATTLTISSRAQWGTSTVESCSNGSTVYEAKYRSFLALVKSVFNGKIGEIMQLVNTASVIAQQASIAIAQQQPVAVNNAVQ